MEKRFQKNKENFICEECATKVEGGGYTDHCPNCLWSKHVDINPGDRKSSCGGKMEPSGVVRKGENYFIYYCCLLCGFQHRVKKAEKDNFEEIIKISKNKIEDGNKRRVEKKSRRSS